MFTLVYERRVFKDLDKIPKPDLGRALEAFKELTVEPHPVGSKKLSGRVLFYRIRQGDYRIVYTVDYPEKVVRIILVAHRKESYRNL